MTRPGANAANDPLVACASVLLHLLDAESEAIDQVRALGTPQELLPTIAGNYVRAALGVLADHGTDARAFERDLRARMTTEFLRGTHGARLLELARRCGSADPDHATRKR